MISVRTLASALCLLGTVTTAQARMHQICFEIPDAGSPPNRAIFGCRIDGGGSCLIDTPVSGSATARPNMAAHWPGTPLGTAGGAFWAYDLPNAGKYTADVWFFDANGKSLTGNTPRKCSVNVDTSVPRVPGHATRGAELTGFTTDASGLATTGIWKATAAEELNSPTLQLEVPADFVVTGGGVIGAQMPAGALIDRSMRVSDRVWEARTSDMLLPNPHQQTIFAIGLRIEGIQARDLGKMITSTSLSNSTIEPHPATQVMRSGSGIVVGGGVRTEGSNSLRLLGQFVTVSAPIISRGLRCTPVAGILDCRQVTEASGWRAESKDHGSPHPGFVHAQLLEMPATVTVGGALFEVHGKHVQATSGVAAHPAIDVGGLRGEYALTSIGAAVDWRSHGPSGNLLWKLEPRADLGGASVSSKDHVFPSPATVTAFAIGIKLVAPGGSREPICRIDKETGQLLCF